MQLPDEERTLTGDEFDHLLRRLDSDPERAGQQYITLQRKLTEFFEHRGCIFPEKLADQTLDIVGRRLAKGEVIRAENPMVYHLGVARNVWYEYLRTSESRNEQWESLPPHESSAVEALLAQQAQQAQENQWETERQLECLTQCLHSLPPERRNLIENYYQGDWQTRIENRKQMAERMGLEQVGLRTRAHRIRRELERCVKERMKRDKK